MPNGRSGGFSLKPAEFELLLKQHDEEALLAKTLKQPVTTVEILRTLKAWKRGEIFIEEQDRSWYIVHFPEWVSVGEGSPLFHGLRQAHANSVMNWAKEHDKDEGTV